MFTFDILYAKVPVARQDLYFFKILTILLGLNNTGYSCHLRTLIARPSVKGNKGP